jgi:outer membrane protein TolC
MLPCSIRGVLTGAAFVGLVVPGLPAQQGASQRASQPAAARTDTLRLSVEDAVARALRSSDEARIADAQVDLAEASVTAARAAALPQLRLNGSYQQVLKNARAEIVGALFNQNYVYASNLNLQQSLFQGGRVVAAAQVASRTERAVAFQRDETRASLAVLAQAAYLDVIFTTRVADIQATNLRLADERVAQAEQLERAGRASRYDVLRARVERANIEPTVRDAEAARAGAELDLRALLNLPADQPLALVTALDGERVRALATEARRSTVRNDRAAVKAAELTASARRAAIRLARADLLPSFNAGFTFGYLALPTSPGFPTVGGDRGNEFCPAGAPPTQQCQNNGWFPDRNFAITMTWPLFDGLRAKGQIDLAQAQTQVAELQAQQMREAVTFEVASARYELERAEAIAAAQATTVREAEEAFALASLRFERGIGTQLEVSDAQFALLRARVIDARALFDLYLAVAEFARVRAEPIPLPSGGTVNLRPSSN